MEVQQEFHRACTAVRRRTINLTSIQRRFLLIQQQHHRTTSHQIMIDQDDRLIFFRVFQFDESTDDNLRQRNETRNKRQKRRIICRSIEI